MSTTSALLIPFAINHTNKILSPREQQVLSLIAFEYTTAEIASKLFLSSHTINDHKKNLKYKLNVRNTAGMVRRGFELGLLG